MRKQINVKREYRRGNQKWTIQRNWQHLVHNTQEEDKKNQEQNHDYSEKMKKKKINLPRGAHRADTEKSCNNL